MKMNWETFKILTDKQKEEYNFRFKDKEEIHIFSLINSTMVLFSFVVIIMFLSYLIITMPALEQYKSQISSYVAMAGKIFFVIGIIIIGYVIDFIVRMSWYVYQYAKWQKENKIVFVRWWTKWLK
jgi:hypothetical protein